MPVSSRNTSGRTDARTTRAFWWLFVGAFLFALFPSAFSHSLANASGPSSNRLLNYQLRLTDPSGIPVADGTKNIKISFFAASTGGTPVATDCGTTGTPVGRKVIFTNGVGSVLIGETTADASHNCTDGSAPNAISATLFDNTALFIGITVESDAEMTPRKRIVATGYSLNADKLDDLDSSAVGGSNAFVPVTDSSGNFTLTQNLTVDTNTLFVDATNNRVGLGTITPITTLHVNGRGSFGDSVTSANAERALNLISSDAVMRVLRVSADIDTASPSVELIHRSTPEGADTDFWDWFINSSGFHIRDRAPTDQIRFTINGSGNIGIGTTAPAEDLQLHRGIGDNPVMYLSDGDVAHGMTSVVPTDVIGRFTSTNATEGGLQITGLNDGQTTANGALQLYGILGDSSNSAPVVVVRSGVVSGTTTANLASNRRPFQVQKNDGSALMTIMGNGDVGIGLGQAIAPTSAVNAVLDVNTTDTGARLVQLNDSGRIVRIAGSLTEISSGNHPLLAGLELTAPVITGSVATVSDTATLYISGAPIATVTGGNYALLVDAGDSRFGGHVLPETDDVLDLGDNTHRWRDLYLGPATLHIGTSTSDEGTISYNTTTNALQIDTTAGGSVEIAGGSGSSGCTVDASGNFSCAGTVSGGGGAGAFVDGGNSFGAAATLGTNDNFGLNFETNGTTRMMLDVNGNVGIGTASPGVKLDVIGAQKLSNATGLSLAGDPQLNTFLALDNTATNFVNLAHYSVLNSQARGTITVSNSSTLWQNNFLQMLVHGSTHSVDSYLSDSTSDAGVAMVLAQGSQINKLAIGTYDPDPMTFFTSNLQRMTILSGGNVGIGTTNPASFKLQVDGSVGPNADNTYDLGSSSLRWKTLHVGPGSIVVHNDATNTLKATLGFSGSTAQLATDSATPLQLTTGGNTGINVTSGGNISLGSATIGPTVSVMGNRGVFSISGGNVLNFTVPTNGFQFFLGGIMTVDKNFEVRDSSLIARDSGSNTVRVNIPSAGDAYFNNGNVGIGVVNPNSKLQVQGANTAGTGTLTTSGGTTVTGTGSTFTAQLQVGDSVSASLQTRRVIAIATDTSLTIDSAFSPDLSAATFTFSRPRLFVQEGGNVGIGTTMSLQKLDIVTGVGNGTVNESGSMRLRHSNADGNTMTMQLGVNNAGGGAGGGSNNQGYGYLQSHYWGGGVNTIALNPQGGGVAIGNNMANGARLDVHGDILSRGAATNAPMSKIGFAGSGDYPATPAYVGSFADNGIWSSGIALTFHTVQGADISATNGSERMRISSAGNVGIGDATPTALLSVSNERFMVNSSGDITSTYNSGAASTASGAGSNSTTLVLIDATNFDVGNYVFVNATYAKITAKAANTLTISPALSWSDTQAVTEYHIPEIGGQDIPTPSPLENRYGRGYFIDGIVTGNNSTRFTDNLIDTTANTLAINQLNNRPVTFGTGLITIGGDLTVTGNISAPASGTSGYWSRTGTTLKTATAGDSVVINETALSGTEKFRVADTAVLFDGATGATPVSGAGTRLMWVPAKWAFRAGKVTTGSWDAANIGDASVAMGQDTIASGTGSTAFGIQSTASGLTSFAQGGSTASGAFSIAMGTQSTANAQAAIALGDTVTASGISAVALGRQLTASGQSSVALGEFVTAGSATGAMAFGRGVDGANPLTNSAANSLAIGFNSTIPTLFIGASSGIGTTGNVGIGTSSPDTMLEVAGGIMGTGVSVGAGLTPVSGRIEANNTVRASRNGAPAQYIEMFGGDGNFNPYLNAAAFGSYDLRSGGTQVVGLFTDGSAHFSNFVGSPFGGQGRHENYMLYSEQFDNGAWVKTGNSVTANAVAAPDGTMTADTITNTGGLGTDDVKQTAGSGAASITTWAASIWVKTSSGTATISLRVDNGGTQGTPYPVTATTSWQRVSFLQSFGVANTPTFLIINGTNTVHVWGAQIEQQSSLGIYARTEATAITSIGRGAVVDGSLLIAGAGRLTTESTADVLRVTTPDSLTTGGDIRARNFRLVDNASPTNATTGRIFAQDGNSMNLSAGTQIVINAATLDMSQQQTTVNTGANHFIAQSSQNTFDLHSGASNDGSAAALFALTTQGAASGTRYGQRLTFAPGATFSGITEKALSILATDNTSTSGTLYGLDVDVSGGTNVNKTRHAAVFSGGNVGIGTTGPLSRLHEQNAPATAGTGTITSSGTAVTGTGTTFTTQLHTGDAIIASGQTRLVATIASDTSLTTDTAFNPVVTGAFFTYQQPGLRLADDGGTMDVILTADGKLGVGTVSPLASLHVQSSTLPVRIQRQAAGNLIEIYDANPTVRFSVDNLGLATAGDFKALSGGDNPGTLELWNSGAQVASSIGSVNFMSSQNGNKTYGKIESVMTVIDSGIQAGDMMFSTLAAGTLTERMRIEDGGNVGIGTSSPNNKLQVSGLINFDDTNFNTFLGKSTGGSAGASDDRNTAVGYQAGDAFNNSGGADNTIIGSSAGTALTSGDSNTALGSEALFNATTSTYLIGIGNKALYENVDGTANVAIGHLSLENYRYSANTAIGYLSMRNAVTNNFNVAIGYAAGMNITTNSNSITSTASCGVGCVTVTTPSTTGLANGDEVQITGTTDYNGTHFNITNVTGTTFDIADTFTSSQTGYWGEVNLGHANTMIGYNSGQGASGATASANTFIGYQTGQSISTGTDNTFIGAATGGSVTTGSSNIIIGAFTSPSSATASSELNIGNTLYGDLSTDSIGIGDSTPTEATLVVGSAGAGNIYATFASSGTAALCWDNSGASLINDCSGTPVADYAEMYPTSTDVIAGDIVALGERQVTTETGETMREFVKAAVPYGRGVLGVVSDPDKATDFNVIGYNIRDEDHPMPIALNGRVSAAVTTENGAIEPGDPITASATVPGAGMKATRAGMIVGFALDAYDDAGSGKLLVFVNPGWWNGIEVQGNNAASGVSKLHELTVEADQDMMGYGLLNVGFIRGVGDLWSIDTQGRIISKEVTADTLTAKAISVRQTDDSKTIGKATIYAGSSAAVVENAAVRKNSEIFVTFKKDPGSSWWIDETHDGMFIIQTKLPVGEDVVFSYLIIGVVDETTPPPPTEPAPEPEADPQLEPVPEPTPGMSVPLGSDPEGSGTAVEPAPEPQPEPELQPEPEPQPEPELQPEPEPEPTQE